ncbi:MAG: hypothetical protein R3344_05260 [Acidobacteriota bacterium]|nr:hypothetical protein [Acidobacteriota bacterium]
MNHSGMNPTQARRALVALVAVALLVTACGEEIVVRQTTTVYRDGTVQRVVEIAGRDSEGNVPAERDWFRDEVRLTLADPEAWGRVDELPGLIRAEGFFNRPADIPSTLTHETDAGPVSDRTSVEIEHEDLLLLRRWVFAETHGDPFGYATLESSLDAVVELALDALRDELYREFGGGLDVSGAEMFIQHKAKPLAHDLLRAIRSNRLRGAPTSGAAAIEYVLIKHGVPADVPPVLDPMDSLDDLVDPVLAWARESVAGALSTDDQTIDPADLDFWPTENSIEEYWNEDLPPPTGRAAEFVDRMETLGMGLTGYYGEGGAPNFRFEIRVEMPGVVLATNGTPEGNGAIWIFRGADLPSEDATMRIESVELDDEALVSVGARRDLDTAELLQLVDLLGTRDTSGELRKLIAEAIERGRLSHIEESAEDELEFLARELVDLLDPTRERWPAP